MDMGLSNSWWYHGASTREMNELGDTARNTVTDYGAGEG